MIEKSNMKVLVVDDELEIVDLMDAFLSPYYEIVTAQNGKEALEMVEREKPDLILLDIMMPDIDGYEVCKTIKSNPSLQSIPVVMITALFMRENRIEGIESGADEFLKKPVDRLELLTRVKSLLRIKQLHDELVAERDKLDMQNRIRTILTRTTPQFFKKLPAEEKSILIHQMSEMVGKVVLESCEIDACDNKSLHAEDIFCNLMNQLGGSFTFNELDGGGMSIVKGVVCPWGAEEAHENPILCHLTRAILSNIVDNCYENGSVDILKTIGNGDNCCLLEVRKRIADA